MNKNLNIEELVAVEFQAVEYARMALFAAMGDLGVPGAVVTWFELGVTIIARKVDAGIARRQLAHTGFRVPGACRAISAIPGSAIRCGVLGGAERSFLCE